MPSKIFLIAHEANYRRFFFPTDILLADIPINIETLTRQIIILSRKARFLRSKFLLYLNKYRIYRLKKLNKQLNNICNNYSKNATKINIYTRYILIKKNTIDKITSRSIAYLISYRFNGEIEYLVFSEFD